jgi:hypothetical protein
MKCKINVNTTLYLSLLILFEKLSVLKHVLENYFYQ